MLVVVWDRGAQSTVFVCLETHEKAVFYIGPAEISATRQRQPVELCPEVEFLNEIQTKVFLLIIRSVLYSVA